MSADSAFDALAAEFAPSGAVASKMFGKRALTLNKKAFACLIDDESMTFRLGADTTTHAAALALPGAALWDPSGMHRPFKDWVRVPISSEAEWSNLAARALENLAASFG
ncbi:MAG: hypothetical protein QOH55_799 [Microbacteriaceae bacterium]|jgi:hypothetical protein|nr:hypothetical protein [Microbacteriaceae bacterium]MDQ1609093.1 hypothetical protein [Microbacteriaceae bacterium]